MSVLLSDLQSVAVAAVLADGVRVNIVAPVVMSRIDCVAPAEMAIPLIVF